MDGRAPASSVLRRGGGRGEYRAWVVTTATGEETDGNRDDDDDSGDGGFER